MKSIQKTEVLSQLHASNATQNGFLRRTVDAAHQFYSFTLEDEQALFSLIWHYHKNSKILTPGTWVGGKVHTVGDVAKRMLAHNWSFQELAQGKITGNYIPGWFQSCVEIDQQFSYKKFNTLVVQLPNNTERKDCPSGTFRIIDGTHRTVVLAHRILQKTTPFEPISCILVLPKP